MEGFYVGFLPRELPLAPTQPMDASGEEDPTEFSTGAGELTWLMVSSSVRFRSDIILTN